MWHLLKFWNWEYLNFAKEFQVENVTPACMLQKDNLAASVEYLISRQLKCKTLDLRLVFALQLQADFKLETTRGSTIIQFIARQYGIQSDTSSIKDPMRLLLLKYSNLGENKSPHRGLVKAIYWKLGNENASNAHSHPWRVVIEQISEKRNDLVKYQTFEIGLLMPCGGTWSGIWQFGGKLLIDDTDMGSNGERRDHQFTNPLRKLNAEIMEREYFSCLNPLQGRKYSPLSLSLISLKTEITSNLWTNSLYILSVCEHMPISSLTNRIKTQKKSFDGRDGRNSSSGWLACKTCGE